MEQRGNIAGDFPWCKVSPRFSELFLRGGDCVRSGKLCPPKLQKSMQIPAPCKFGPAKLSFCSHPPTKRLPKRISIPSSPVSIKFASARSSLLLAVAHEMLAQQKIHTNGCQSHFKSSLHPQDPHFCSRPPTKGQPNRRAVPTPFQIKLASADLHFFSRPPSKGRPK